MDDNVAVAELEVVPWKRYGKNRVYVNTADGVRVGWHDLVTGKSVIDLEEHTEAFRRALEAWRRADVGPGVPDCHEEGDGCDPEGDVVVDENASPPDESAEPVAAATPSWTDLTHNVAGASARAEALRLRAAAPTRTLVARVLGIKTDERAWRVGAGGEVKVGKQLERLRKQDPRWKCLHAIQVGKAGSDIDHLVVGPGGVYSLNAKCHPGGNLWIGGNTFMVNGQRQDYVRNSRFEAQRASRLLAAECGRPVHVLGVIVPVDAKSIVIKTKPTDVAIVNRMALVGWLRARGTVLDEEAVTLTFEAARRSTTWET
ncbi:MAG: nuclease-related domain-containing protein [Acidimicrobiales bacterium]